MSKKIFIGEIDKESYYGTPIEMFKKAVELYKLDEFSISTNNPQFIETLEVLCGEENIKVFLKLNGEYKYVSVLTAYNYLGELYNTIDAMRIARMMGTDIDDILDVDIDKYNKKWKFENEDLNRSVDE